MSSEETPASKLHDSTSVDEGVVADSRDAPLQVPPTSVTPASSSESDALRATRPYLLAPRPPQPFDKYTLIGKLGHGGMAEVNLAVSEGRGGFRKLLVVKRLHAHLAAEPGFIEMFLDEARLGARLNHPHCVQTYEVGDWQGNFFLALEHLNGQGLERLLRMCAQLNRPIPVEVGARIVADALDGLAYAHELRDFDGTPLCVVHRDVSPQNIFVTYGGVVKLLDFGIAKAATHVVETRTGVIKGKYGYIAPEQALCEDVDVRSDIWSMGVVLWEVLTGRRLFKNANELATLHQTLHGRISPPSTVRREIPRTLDGICIRALARDPDARYQTAREMKAALDAYLAPAAVGRTQIEALMQDRFVDVIAVHDETIARCLTGVADASLSIDVSVMSSSSHDVTKTPVSGVHSNSKPPSAGDTLSVEGTEMPAPGSASGPAWISVLPPDKADPRAGLSWTATIALLLTTLALFGGVMMWLVSLPWDEAPASMPRRASSAEEAKPPERNAAADDGTVEQVPSAIAGGTADRGGIAEHSAPVDAPPILVIDAAEPDAPVAVETHGPRSRRAVRRAARDRRAALAAQSSSREIGFLSLATTPWTQVTAEGRDLGTTPLIRVPLSAGTHTLRLTNPEFGIDTTYRVVLRAGEVSSRRLGLR